MATNPLTDHKPLIPVMHRDALGFPEHEPRGEYDRATYAELEFALTFGFEFDAHFCAYSLPSIERRLATEKALEFGPQMVLFVVDVDAEYNDAEASKTANLFADHPGGYLYTTKRGYRIVYRLADPFTLSTVNDRRMWSASYKHWLQLLRDTYQITGDESCADFTRLYRLPRVTRDGEAQNPVTVGDPANVGFWNVAGVTADAPAAPTITPEIVTITDKHLEAAELLGRVWPSEGRHRAHLALSGALAYAGWSITDIADFCSVVAEAQEPGNGNLEKRFKAARSSVEKVQAGMAVQGWPSLEPFVGREIIEKATELLGIEKAPQRDDKFAAAIKALTRKPPREEAESLWRAAQRRGTRSTDANAQYEAELLNRVFKGRPLADDIEEEDGALGSTLMAMIRIAPEAPDIIIAERVIKSIPRLSTDTLLGLINHARGVVKEEAEAKELGGEFELEQSGPREGKPIANSLHNWEIALNLLQVKLRFNDFSYRKLLKVGDGKEQIVEDHHVADLRFACERQFDFRPSKDDFCDYLTTVARSNSFHPVRDYLDGLPAWDGSPRIDTWLIAFAGAEDTPYVRAVSRLVLLAAVRRVRQPGAKFDEMLILEGRQGTGKSTALQALCPDRDWFTDDLPLHASTKEIIEVTLGKWIVEAPELKGMNNTDSNRLKALMTRIVDESRMAYGREKMIAPRQFILIGSTNDEHYLRDLTGDRRYWPVKTTKSIDVSALVVVRDQLWAEASHYEALGESIRLAPELWPAASAEQEKRKVDEPFKIELESTIGHLQEGWIKVKDVWRILNLVDDKRPKQNDQMKITSVMASMGWFRERHMVDGVTEAYYCKGKTQTVITVSGSPAFGIKLHFGSSEKSTN